MRFLPDKYPVKLSYILIMAKNYFHAGSKNVWLIILVSFTFGCIFALKFFGVNSQWQISAFGNIAQSKAPNSFTACKPKEFSRIYPISIERDAEAVSFGSLKSTVTHLIDSLKRAGDATDISVYLREFNEMDWMAINKDAKYHPASLMKIPLLMCYLKMAEADPSLLKQELVYNKPENVVINTQYYQGPTIEIGKKYTIHELLFYMMAYSDNNATWLLASHFNNNGLKKLFADFCLPEPIEDDAKFVLSANEISVFTKSIYTASYLSPNFSQYAAELMENCTFKEGFVKGLPEGATMWHKFGEWRSIGYDYELHETGIVTINGDEYLLTVMTKGKNTDQLAACIQAISKQINTSFPAP